jgi:hypothetical protein
MKGSTMLGTISMILALNDSMITSGTDLSTLFFNHFRTLSERKGLCIATLRKVNVSKDRVVPCIIAGKIPLESPDTFQPVKWGHVLVSSSQDASLAIIKVSDFSSKMPDYKEPGSKKKNMVKPEDSSPTYNYPYIRRDLKLGEDIHLKTGMYFVGVISGDIMSDFQEMVVTSGEESGAPSGLDESSVQNAAKQDAYMFSKTQYSPPVPQKPGIVLALVPQEKVQKGKPFMVYGTIRGSAVKHEGKKIPQIVHILMSGSEDPDLSHYQISIPVDMQKEDNGSHVSYFAFDCMKEFFYKAGGRFDIPPYFFVSVICKDLHVGPVKVATGQ